MAQLEVAEAGIAQGLEGTFDFRQTGKEFDGFIYGQFQHLRDGLAAVLDFQGVAVKPGAAADFAPHQGRWQEAQRRFQDALETTGTPAASPSPTATLEPSATPTLTATATVAATATPNYTSTPEPTATPYTLEGFQKVYKEKLDQFAKFGLTEQQYRLLHKTELLRKKLYDQVTADVPHTQEQVWARHILVSDEAVALLTIERIRKGEDFGKVASEVSQDTGSAAQGGDLGWFGKGAMVAPFEEAAFSLPVGEISKPIKSDFGWHIIQVIARQDRPLNATEYQTATDKAFQDFLDSLHEPYGVKTYELWMQILPTDPSFNSMATDAANTASAGKR